MPEKELGRLYRNEALRLLGCRPPVGFCDHAVFGRATGLAMDATGMPAMLSAASQPAEARLCSDLALALPSAALAPLLRRHCTWAATQGGAIASVALQDVQAALDALRPLLEPDFWARLRQFLGLRPCFSPAMRPGLSLLFCFGASGQQEGWLLGAQLVPGFGSAPEGFYYPVAMNLELTSQCPLHCPQCYCFLQEGRHMPLATAEHFLKQAGALGVRAVNLSGGETMCYPWINEVVALAHQSCGEADLALSGYGITPQSLDRLIASGATGFYVSLNGPTEQINAHTRDGYSLAVHTLALLQERHFDNVWINWVVHDSNADTLPQMIALGEQYGVRGIMLMAFKPDSHHALPSLPSAAQMRRIADWVRAYEGPLALEVETCYSSLRALCGKTFWGNRNKGPFCGCGAGRDSFSVSLEGKLSPCRHLERYEDNPSLLDYWQNSPVLAELREAALHPLAPCSTCDLLDACRHCMAINPKLHGCLTRGDTTCPLAAEPK